MITVCNKTHKKLMQTRKGFASTEGIKPTTSETGQPLPKQLAKEVPHWQNELWEALSSVKSLHYKPTLLNGVPL